MAGRTALRWGGATDVGRVRTINQDNYLARDEVGLWAVADGMGGHQGGEVASAIACESLAHTFGERTVDGLIDAIEQANAAVYEAGSGNPDLTGMGTTVVALAVVDEDDEEVLAVANVGDSRVYRFSVGELYQLTDDHSLVADLVREGRLSPEEAAVHPQRNIVTRVLGVYDDVPVDVLTVEPRHGDRYVLCSDGLFNEVPEPAIAAVLARVGDPDRAAEELVRRAVEGGGRDNVTVVVVDVVDDGGRAEAASAALGADVGPDAGPVGGLESRAPEASGAQAHVGGDEDGAAGSSGRTDTAEEAELNGADRRGLARRRRLDGPRHSQAKTRRVTWRVVLFSVILVALVGGAFATIQWYGRSTYFVGLEGDHVAIYKGRPGGLLWLDPELVEVTELDRARVPADTIDDLDAGKEQASLGDARTYVDRLSKRADELDSGGTTTTTERPTTTTTRRRTTPTTSRATTTTAAR